MQFVNLQCTLGLIFKSCVASKGAAKSYLCELYAGTLGLACHHEMTKLGLTARCCTALDTEGGGGNARVSLQIILFDVMLRRNSAIPQTRFPVHGNTLFLLRRRALKRASGNAHIWKRGLTQDERRFRAARAGLLLATCDQIHQCIG